MRTFFKNRLFAAGALIICLQVAVAALAPWIMPHDPFDINLEKRLTAPAREYPLGTDALGRCVLSRVMYATRVSLGLSAIASAVIVAVGSAIGMLSGLCGGRTDRAIMQLVNVMLAFPSLILALVISGLIGPSLRGAVAGVAIAGWAPYARLVRGMTLAAREKEYVTAASFLGTRGIRLAARHIFPQILPSLAVLSSYEVKSVILAISGLGFLGLGAQPPTPELGGMLNEARLVMLSAPHLMAAPGVMLFITVLGFSLFGEGFRDIFQIKK